MMSKKRRYQLRFKRRERAKLKREKDKEKDPLVAAHIALKEKMKL